MKDLIRYTLFTVVTVAFFAVTAFPQQNGSIAGRVTDATGSILPGVTVEATSPVLIEKARTAITDGSGQYRLVDLRPGIYTVTFELPGFSTGRRDGVEITVENDGTTLRLDGGKRHGLGIAATRARLMTAYGDRASLTIDSGGAGTTATLRLPWRELAMEGGVAQR